MYGQYLTAVIRRAFQPTARFTDILQILAASAAPAVAKFLGLPVPTPDDTLAYIGAAALAFVALRLFFVAPYQVWQEQVGEIGSLKLALSKPERLELERLGHMRAKKRLRLASALNQHTWGYFIGNGGGRRSRALKIKIVRLMAEANVSPQINSALVILTEELYDRHAEITEGEPTSETTKRFGRAQNITDRIVECLHGQIKDEALLRQLPPSPRSETKPETPPG